MGRMSKEVCSSSVIAAYIDGELEEGPRILFEEHVEGCSPCRAELQAHRLFMCELDAVMAQRMDLEVPANFSRVVAARAASDMSGVRSFAERRKALSFCLILALLAFALLSTSARDSIFHFVGRLTGSFFGVVSFLWTAFYDAAASLTVIFRVLSRKFVVESGSLGLLIVLLALALLLLSRLISNYHRTGAIE
jgi:predicted anti-sigma-YlaC factor YlaD